MTAQQLHQRLNEALAHHKGGRLDRAEAIYRQVAAAAPRVALTFDLWGQLAEQQGRTEDAIRYYLQAIRLDEKLVSVAVRLASAYIGLGKIAEAEKVLTFIIKKNPQNAEGWNALAYVMKVQGRMKEAIAHNQKAITLDPKYVEGWVQFGLTLGLTGNHYQALPHYERALQLNPQFSLARFGRAQSLDRVYRLDEAIAEYDEFLKAQPNHLEARSNRLFALQNSESISREQLFAEHQAYGAIVGRGPATLPDYDLSPEKRLRVAILSPDLRTHSCAYFLEPLLRHLDPARFELYLYHDHFVDDAMSERLRKMAAVWRNFVAQAHHVVERTIRADKPDVIVDLAGHVSVMVRLPIFARRLAPVQITYLGYPDTTGVPAMDFRFTDEIADPPGETDRFATETLVRFAPTAWTYQPPLDAPDVAAPPCAAGAPVTFGCFNSPTKFTNSVFTAWAKILAQVPHSILLLKGRDFEEAPVRERMVARMQAAGIAPDRVELLPRTLTTADHLAHYSRVDIALDTFPYNGTTTTCEALWMGRPVITLCGGRHGSRVGSSLLHAVGHTEWITSSADDYVQRAVAVASAPAELAAKSAALRSDLEGSVLLDAKAQSARFWDAVRACWRAKVQP